MSAADQTSTPMWVCSKGHIVISCEYCPHCWDVDRLTIDGLADLHLEGENEL